MIPLSIDKIRLQFDSCRVCYYQSFVKLPMSIWFTIEHSDDRTKKEIVHFHSILHVKRRIFCIYHKKLLVFIEILNLEYG